MMSTSRILQHTWDTAWATAPPPSCSTLRNLDDDVSWGETCVFAEEDGDPLPFSINTACMPWVTSNSYPSESAFYSPATACPDSWSAVATQVAENGEGSDDRWIDGEIGLQCCPEGFQADGRRGCRPGGSGSWPVVECGEADEEENELRTYDATSWPTSATPSVTALMLRYQPSDTGSAGMTASQASETGSSATGGSGSDNGNGIGSGGSDDGGLSTGATAAIATIIPLVLIIGAIAGFFLWRHKKNRNAAAALAAQNSGDEKAGPPSGSVAAASPTTHHSISKGTAAAYVAGSSQTPHETPEWNIEMDATEAERQKLVNPFEAQSAAGSDGRGEAVELAGMVRVPRKPIAPVELDGTSAVAEVGDAYIPYRPGAEER